MHRRLLACALATSLVLVGSAQAQSDAGTAPSPAPGAQGTASPAKKKSKTRKKGSTSSAKKKKSAKSSKRKSKKGKTLQTVILPGAPSKAEAVAEPVGPPDYEPPQLSATSVTRATRGKAFTVTAHATDDISGVFGPVLHLRKKGMADAEYVPMRMNPAKAGAPGDYALEIPAALTNVDGLEYYIEVWDNAGNGPIRYGSADSPVQVKVEEEKAPAAPPTTVLIQPKGAPPAILHTALLQALASRPVEVNARLTGETGVSGPTVLFRHVGERDFKALPMGNIAGDEYTATVPASMVTSDLEYYIEAFDRFGNGPARSGGPNNPYRLAVGGPVVTRMTPREAMTQAPQKTIEDPGRNTVVGIGLDAGAPGGGGFTLLVRPLWWLRLNGGAAYNYAGFGYRGGISFAPCWCGVTPTLNLDAGHYVSGNFNKFVTVTDPNERTLLSHTTYNFASAQIGLEFGSQRWFNFYLRGGLTYFRSTFSGADLTALAQGKVGTDPSNTYKVGDGKLTALLPSLSLGFNIFVY